MILICLERCLGSYCLSSRFCSFTNWCTYRIENKDLFIDLKKNDNGIYLKLSERKGTLRKTVLIPASGISKLQAVLEEAAAIIKEQPGSSISNNDR